MAFEYPSNFSNGTIVDGVGNLIVYGNYVSGGWFAYAFLMIIFVMSFVVSMGLSSKKALLSSSFITFIFSVYFLRLDLVNPVLVFLLVLLIIVGAIGSKEESSVNI